MSYSIPPILAESVRHLLHKHKRTRRKINPAAPAVPPPPRAAFIGITRGEGLLQRAFLRYAPYTGAITSSRKGAIVSTAIGKARALEGVERGARPRRRCCTFFVLEGAGRDGWQTNEQQAACGPSDARCRRCRWFRAHACLFSPLSQNASPASPCKRNGQPAIQPQQHPKLGRRAPTPRTLNPNPKP
jgi:hypothetical protein